MMWCKQVENAVDCIIYVEMIKKTSLSLYLPHIFLKSDILNPVSIPAGGWSTKQKKK